MTAHPRTLMREQVRANLRALIDRGETRKLSAVIAQLRGLGQVMCPKCHLWHDELVPCDCEEG